MIKVNMKARSGATEQWRPLMPSSIAEIYFYTARVLARFVRLYLCDCSTEAEEQEII